MRTDGYLPAGRGAPTQPLGRERVATMLAGIESSAALNTLDEFDDMAAGSDQITRDESSHRDVAALAETIVEAHRLGLDVGALSVLDRYQRWRRYDTTEMALATDGLNALFANDNSALRILRDVGLGIVDRLPGLKRRFIDAASGGGEGAPRLLRGEPVPKFTGRSRCRRGSNDIRCCGARISIKSRANSSRCEPTNV